MEPRHLEAAIAVWEYCERSAQWVFGQKTGNRKADQIYWALLHDEAGLQRLQIIEDVFSRNISKTTLDQALSVLLDAKLVTMVCERAPGAKRMTERWFAVTTK